MEIGDIVNAEDKKKHPHPIVYIKENGNDSFFGCVISHETNFGNIEMKEEHFRIQDKDGNRYLVQYENSHLIPYQFIKMKDWITNVTVVGKLTESGIEFVINAISNMEPILHDGHIKDL